VGCLGGGATACAAVAEAIRDQDDRHKQSEPHREGEQRERHTHEVAGEQDAGNGGKDCHCPRCAGDGERTSHQVILERPASCP
jgi:hypothetical protein